MLKLIDATIPTDKDLQAAITIRCEVCFNDIDVTDRYKVCFDATAIDNAASGNEPVRWQLVHTFSLVQLLQEAQDRGLDVTQWVTALELKPLTESEAYKRVEQLQKERNV